VRIGWLAVPPSTEPPEAERRRPTPIAYSVPAPLSRSNRRASCMFVPSLYPAAVPVEGTAEPNELDVPPLAPPAATLTLRYPEASRLPAARLVPLESLKPIAVPVAGKADPNELDVPPDPPPAPMLTMRRPAESSCRSPRWPVVNVGADEL